MYIKRDLALKGKKLNVEPACGERDIVVKMTVRCMFVRESVCASVRPILSGQ